MDEERNKRDAIFVSAYVQNYYKGVFMKTRSGGPHTAESPNYAAVFRPASIFVGRPTPFFSRKIL